MYPPPPERPAFDGAAFDKHTIETPEQIGLDFAVAGVGSRFLAILIDTLIQTGIGIAVAIAVFAMTFAIGPGGAPSVWLLALAAFGAFLLLYGYFAIFEIIWNGQTPGKRIIGLRVIKDSGRPLTPAETIGRNLMRIVDQMPAMYAIGIVTMFLNSRNKRLGDLVAGSIVIRESKKDKEAPWLAAGTVQQQPPAPQPVSHGAHRISIDDLRLMDTFLNRRNEMEPDVRSRMASQILARLRAHTEIPEDGRPAEEIIQSLARERRETYGG
ncbi:MAG TPA: RDD family protein [Bryobacteraceae bacterium]|nr:RDD family protein [Bryobacteraceae bacterium]